jgi:S1-C subfamily serine protease
VAGNPFKVADILANSLANKQPWPSQEVKKLTLGRDKSCDLTLEHPSVSLQHAILTLDENGTWRLTDCSSKNGTFVDGHKINSILINTKNEINLGIYKTDLPSLLYLAKKSNNNYFFTSIKNLFWSNLAKYLALACLALTVVGFFQLLASPEESSKQLSQTPPQRQKSSPSQPPPSGAKTPEAPLPTYPQLPQSQERWPSTESESDVVETTKKATVIVGCLENYSQGSGFLINRDYIFTNGHVTKFPGQQCIVANEAFGVIEAKVIARINSNEWGKDDFAVLRLAKNSQVNPLAFSLKAKPADRVFTWGYPGILTELNPRPGQIPETTFSGGYINKIDNSVDIPLIIHSANISQGNSGGPLLNERGLVVGVNTFISSKDSYQANYSLAAQGAINFLRRNSIPFEQWE